MSLWVKPMESVNPTNSAKPIEEPNEQIRPGMWTTMLLSIAIHTIPNSWMIFDTRVELMTSIQSCCKWQFIASTCLNVSLSKTG